MKKNNVSNKNNAPNLSFVDYVLSYLILGALLSTLEKSKKNNTSCKKSVSKEI